MRTKQVWLLVLTVAVLLIFYLLVTSSSDESGYTHYESGTNPRASRKFRNVIVHLDLKGAPPRVEYLEQFFALLSRHFVDGVLIEYEDMFPYSGEIEPIRRDVHYSVADIRRILAAAEKNNLEVIPLIQSFGHLEFVLKRPHFMQLSEDLIDLNTICISDEKSIEIVQQMILQIRELHPNATRIHIGADEAYHVAEDKRCTDRMEKEKIGRSQLKMNHIARIGKFARGAGFKTVFAWNDMFDKESEDSIREAKVHEYIVPVVWGYRTDVTEPGYFPDGLFDRIADVFDEFYVASAYKGADGSRQQFSNISRYLEVQKSYVKLMDLHPNAGKKVEGIFVTGWSRYNHFNVLCELLPVAVPSLIVDLTFLNYQLGSSRSWKAMKESLRCGDKHYLRGIQIEWAIHDCSFPGANAFEIVMNDWKNLVDRRIFGKNGMRSTSAEAVTVLNRLKNALKDVLYKNDIEEVYNQYLQDFHSIQTSSDVDGSTVAEKNTLSR
ncbi:unnamed protein product [Caenorhabditis sp. 36 PRJEB53466]|nr:unnamed protein product [Caenorhabditis sp. 36 PRJEB53466]